MAWITRVNTVFVDIVPVIACRIHTEGRKSDFIIEVTCEFNFFMAQQPLVGQGLVIIQASRSHSDTPHSVRLLFTSDRSEAQTSTWQHTTLTRDIFVPGGIRTSNTSKQAVANPRIRPRAYTGIGELHFTDRVGPTYFHRHVQNLLSFRNACTVLSHTCLNFLTYDIFCY